MSLLSKFKNDPLFAKVMRSSGSLFSNNTISMGLSVVQSIMATRLLGPAGYGLIGLVMAFPATINSIFSFRMNEVIVRYGGDYLNKQEKEKAAALLKAAGLTEAAVSLLAFLVVLFTASLAETYSAKTPGTAWMFTVFAIGLLANFNTETSTGILQITGRIRLLGVINLIQSIFTLLIITCAFFLNGTLVTVLIAYLVGKTILGLGMFFVAQVQIHKALGSGWWRQSFSALDSWREIFRFSISSNVSATIIKIFRESEVLWVAFFLDTTAVGYYRVAYNLVYFLALPSDPLIHVTFPEISRLVTEKAWGKIKNFLKKITTLSLAYNILLGAAYIFLGRWIILIFSGEKFVNAYPALVALTIGLVFNYILFWNRPLLLALGLPEFPIYTTLVSGFIKLTLSFWLVPTYGIVAAGALLSYYYITSVGIMALRGVRQIQHNENSTHH